ncbi:alpha/beta fold hydrolase [Thalassotalea aquiviva]|uniref:alpha/beta fold hydrolase n=1 Tax=Thalassotalea aquiviva TaxID=3242415 RepID=UPI00352ABC25
MKIVLLHGLFMNSLVMVPMARRLSQLGWQVQTISYNTVRPNKDSVFAKLDKAIGQGPTILVGHSLGGLVITHYLASRQFSTDTIPMVITLGTPHQGAKIVKDMAKFKLDPILGTSTQFGLIPQEFAKTWNYPQQLISIAGNVKIGARPIMDKFLREDIEESDGTVGVEETEIDGMSKHLVIKQSHMSMLFAKEVPKMIDEFAREVSKEYSS